MRIVGRADPTAGEMTNSPCLRRRSALSLAILAVAPACVSAPTRPLPIGEPTTEVKVFDPTGVESDGTPLAEQVSGLRAGWLARAEAATDASAAGAAAVAIDGLQQDPPAAQGVQSGVVQPPQQSQDPTEERRRMEARLRIAFGDTILINPDGSVTKQYFLSQSAGALFATLLKKLTAPEAPAPAGINQYGGAQLDSVLGRMLGVSNEVELVFIERFEAVEDTAVRAPNQFRATIAAGRTNALALVTARPESLSAFEKALDLFYANIPQVQIEVKVVEYTTSDSLSLGAVPFDANTPTIQNNGSGRLIRSLISDFTASGFGQSGGGNAGGIISLGGIHQSLELNAQLQLLESQNVADVKSQPRMVVRNGGVATVSTKTSQPYPVARIVNQTVTSTDIQFRDVGITMDIRPEIAGTETVVLNIFVSVSAITGFVASEPIPTPIISSREAATAVHLREGQTTVIGGLVSESNFETERKIPILGDIPLLGLLFRSTLTQREKTTLEFHITPRILASTRRTSGSGG